MTKSELEAKRFREADQRFEAGDTPNRRRLEESIAQARAGLGIEMTLEELREYVFGEPKSHPDEKKAESLEQQRAALLVATVPE